MNPRSLELAIRAYSLSLNSVAKRISGSTRGRVGRHETCQDVFRPHQYLSGVTDFRSHDANASLSPIPNLVGSRFSSALRKLSFPRRRLIFEASAICASRIIGSQSRSIDPISDQTAAHRRIKTVLSVKNRYFVAVGKLLR